VPCGAKSDSKRVLGVYPSGKHDLFLFINFMFGRAVRDGSARGTVPVSLESWRGFLPSVVSGGGS
jgi:hypothetical protein